MPRAWPSKADSHPPYLTSQTWKIALKEAIMGTQNSLPAESQNAEKSERLEKSDKLENQIGWKRARSGRQKSS